MMEMAVEKNETRFGRQCGHCDHSVMTWTAPQVPRDNGPFVADERDILESFLERYRATLIRKCAGLSPEQLVEQSAPPSNLSLLGLIRHMTEVERSWFRRRFAGETVGRAYISPEDPDADIEGGAPGTAEADYAAYLRELESAREATAAHALDETFFHTDRKVEMSLRWIYVHMIEEYARHCGHADLIRERIDGAIGV
jgi:uncharacterized damage-inducible protein DinB